MSGILCTNCLGLIRPENIENWSNFNVVPAICDKCNITFWIKITHDNHTVGNITSKYQLSLPIGAAVLIIMKEHPFYGMVGSIIDKKYTHYLINVNNKQLLMQESCVQCLTN